MPAKRLKTGGRITMNTDPTRRWQIPRQRCLPRNLKVPKAAGFSDSSLSNLWEEVRGQRSEVRVNAVIRDATPNQTYIGVNKNTPLNEKNQGFYCIGYPVKQEE
jgi:hypothetical protein